MISCAPKASRQTVAMNRETINQIDDASTLDTLIEYHEQTAALLKKRAAQLRERRDMRERNRIRMGELSASPARVCHYLASGRPLDEAIARTADDLTARLDTIEAHWKRFLRSRRREVTMQREIMVARLAGMKKSDATIARTMGLHVKSVSRILRRAKNLKTPFPLVQSA